MSKRSIKDLKGELQKVKHITPWSEIKENEIYHIPPLITLERRDVKIISKREKEATYKVIGDTASTERTMHDSSVFARFLIKRKKY